MHASVFFIRVNLLLKRCFWLFFGFEYTVNSKIGYIYCCGGNFNGLDDG